MRTAVRQVTWIPRLAPVHEIAPLGRVQLKCWSHSEKAQNVPRLLVVEFAVVDDFYVEVEGSGYLI